MALRSTRDIPPRDLLERERIVVELLSADLSFGRSRDIPSGR
jgi:hypothetical protein